MFTNSVAIENHQKLKEFDDLAMHDDRDQSLRESNDRSGHRNDRFNNDQQNIQTYNFRFRYKIFSFSKSFKHFQKCSFEKSFNPLSINRTLRLSVLVTHDYLPITFMSHQ